MDSGQIRTNTKLVDFSFVKFANPCAEINDVIGQRSTLETIQRSVQRSAHVCLQFYLFPGRLNLSWPVSIIRIITLVNSVNRQSRMRLCRVHSKFGKSII